MTSQTAAEGTPWYQNFWPWFIVILLGVSVVASLVTVAIAYHYRDVDVRIGADAEPSPPVDSTAREPGR
jgi:hypothetical protein